MVVVNNFFNMYQSIIFMHYALPANVVEINRANPALTVNEMQNREVPRIHGYMD